MIGVLSTVLTICLVGCSKTSKPKDVKYNLYVPATHLWAGQGDSSFNRIYIYDADSITLLDSIWQAHFTENLAVSPDGKWLYVVNRTAYNVPRTLWKIDVQTKQVVWSRSDEGMGGGGAGFRLLKNGALLLLGNDVLQSDNGALVQRLDRSPHAMEGPESGTMVAATVGDTLVTVLDVETGKTSGQFVPRDSSGNAMMSIYRARLHPDSRRILAVGLSYGVWFVVGDIETGETLFRHRIYRPYGEIAISSDGDLAAVTGHGTPAFGEDGPVYVFDLQTLSFIGPTPAIPGAQVRFLPGNRRIVTAPVPDPGFSDAGPLLVINLATMTLVELIWPMPTDPPKNENVGSLGIGPRP